MELARAAARRLFSSERALDCRTCLPLPIASRVRFSGLPRVNPSFFFSASAFLVRSEITSLSCWAIVAMTPMVRVFASGMSAHTNETPESRRVKMNATLRVSRSSLAISSTAPSDLQVAMARISSGRSLRLPDSMSLYSPMIWPRRRMKLSTLVRWAPMPSPEAPWRSVETR